MTTTADAKIRVTADVGDAKRKVRDLGDGVTNLNGTVKAGQERIEKLATAVTGTSSVLGGMGAKAGAAAGAVSNLAAAFLAGGPPLVALSAAATAGAFAFSKLAESYEEVQAQAKLAETAMQAVGDAIRDRAKKEADDLAQALRNVQAELSLMGLSTAERSVATAQDAEFGIRARIETLQESISRKRAEISGLTSRSPFEASQSVLSGNEEAYQRNLKAQREMLRTYETQLQAAKENLVVATQTTDDLELRLEHQKELDRLEKARRDAARKREADRRKHDREVGPGLVDDDAHVEAYRAQQALNAELAEMEEESMLLQGKQAEWLANIQKEAAEHGLEVWKEKEKERTRILKEETKRREEIEREHVAFVMKVSGEAIGFVANLTEQAFGHLLDVAEDLAAGQEVNFAKVAAAFIRQIGTQVFGIGVRSMADGAYYLAQSLVPGGQVNIPAAVAHLSTGAALMTTGGAMAASGAVASGMISRSSFGGGGGGGGALAGGSLAPRGGGGGPNYNDPGSGNVTINFNGGTQLGDPTERALTMRRDMRRASRNVYMPRTG